MATGAADHAAVASEPNHGRRFLALWIGASIVATPLVAIFLGPALPPGNGSAQGKEQVFDNQWMLTIVTPVFLFVVILLGYVVVAFRSRTPELVDGPPVRGNARIQLLWLVITPVVVLFLAGFGSYELVQSGAGGGQGPTPAFQPAGYQQALDVQVIGQQWEFTYRFPTYGGVETPHLVLPANTLVRLHVTSLDAIHSFWAYQLGVKADANPGVDNVVYVQTKKPMAFDIHCAELCGLWHGYMFDTGHVVPSSQFAGWIKQQQSYFAPVTKLLPKYATTYLPEPSRRAG
ncbi:MAG TPA: cytochrome c oxidase subunit II [Gaiellaceae bacterium]|nr:cytochrome c oxidase subunit II [Gaiellaceae bacterium]